MEGLTPRQEQVLEFIRDSVRANGYPPTVREICTGLDLSSPSTVHAPRATCTVRPRHCIAEGRISSCSSPNPCPATQAAAESTRTG